VLELGVGPVPIPFNLEADDVSVESDHAVKVADKDPYHIDLGRHEELPR
jgi:hypothetical protein